MKCYERDEKFDFISTDVYSFHVDRSPIATDTFLCTYHGTASDIIANEHAEQKILIPEIREKINQSSVTSNTNSEILLSSKYSAAISRNSFTVNLSIALYISWMESI